MTTTISDTFRNAAGTGVGGVVVRAALVAASEVLTGGGAIIREAETTTASDGTWSLMLTPTADLLVAGGAFYLVTADGHRWTVDVPSAGGPYTLADVLVEPAPLASLGLTTATGVALATIDAKGDLLVGSGPDAIARLAVGTNDYVLTADSTAANGVKWATVTAGAAANGLPVGGTTGQYLRKSSATDFDAGWDTVTASDVGADAAGTAAGLVGALTAADVGAVPTSRTVSAGTGLSGGGDLSANRTLALAAIAAGSVLANTTGGAAAPSAVDIDTTLKTALALVVADVSGAAPAADPTLTGTVTVSGRVVVTPDTLTDGATIATDASTGNNFRVTLTGSHTLGNPTNASDGQHILFELVQDATGSRVCTLGTKFNDPNGYYTGQSTAANKRDYLGVVYNSGADKFDVLAFSAGY